MRFVPMYLRAARKATGGTNQGDTFHFPPVTTPVHTVEVASGMHPASRGDGFNGRDLSNDLKVHDVSASSVSGLQMPDTYASIIIPQVSMTEAERQASAAPAAAARYERRLLASAAGPCSAPLCPRLPTCLVPTDPRAPPAGHPRAPPWPHPRRTRATRLCRRETVGTVPPPLRTSATRSHPRTDVLRAHPAPCAPERLQQGAPDQAPAADVTATPTARALPPASTTHRLLPPTAPDGLLAPETDTDAAPGGG